jgi:biopolymer transport protein ExbD
MSLRGSYTLSRSASGGGVRKRSALAMYQSHYGPNMTPMVDVVMVILVFFMASAAILGPDWFLKAALPRQAAGAVDEDTMTRVRLTLRVVDGVTRVDSSTRRPGAGGTGASGGGVSPSAAAVKSRELAAALPADVAGWMREVLGGAQGAAAVKVESLVIVIDPAADVPYADVVAVHEACQAAGVTKIALLPTAAEAEPSAAPVQSPGRAPTPGP